MNYEPNTKRWEKGDLVLHDADAKKAHMLMHVVGYTRDGLCKTKYVERGEQYPREVFKNDLKYLHDPKRFGLDYWAGFPVLATEPLACPICGGVIDVGLMPDEDEFDYPLARECGFDFTDDHTDERDTHPEFIYVVEEMQCLEDECGVGMGYGRRWYLDAETITYSADPPLTPKQQAENERKAQEAAGQQGLFD